MTSPETGTVVGAVGSRGPAAGGHPARGQGRRVGGPGGAAAAAPPPGMRFLPGSPWRRSPCGAGKCVLATRVTTAPCAVQCRAAVCEGLPAYMDDQEHAHITVVARSWRITSG